MSTLLRSKFNDTGCSNPLTVLQIPKKTILPRTYTSSHIFEDCIGNDCQQDDADNVLYKTLSYEAFCAGEEGEQIIPYAPRNAKTCRKIPVKETTFVRHSKDSNGRKMINEYVKERKIGRGSYGKVVLYRNNNDGTPYAIKAVCKSRLHKLRVTQSESAMTDVLREVTIMKMLEHPNIVNLFEVIDDQKSDYLYLVLEYVEGSSISSISETRQVDEPTARKYFRDIIAGLIYLHSHNIVHGDIKPENLLLTRSGRVKIGDFSVSVAIEDDNDELWRCPGTPAFTAPECCSDIVYHGKAADTWAAGVSLYFMVVGYYPFLADSALETYDKIVNSPLSFPEELDLELKDLLQALLCKDPMQRIALDSVVKHPWLVKEGGPVPVNSSCSCKLNGK